MRGRGFPNAERLRLVVDLVSKRRVRFRFGLACSILIFRNRGLFVWFVRDLPGDFAVRG